MAHTQPFEVWAVEIIEPDGWHELTVFFSRREAEQFLIKANHDDKNGECWRLDIDPWRRKLPWPKQK